MFMLRRFGIAVVVLAAAASASGQTGTKQPTPDEYTGTIANMTPGAGSKISIQVLRWSSDADRERVLSVLDSVKEKSQEEQTKALWDLPTVGYIWSTGPLGYALKYAHRLAVPSGGERVVVITDRPLGSWEQPKWTVTGHDGVSKNAFTLVELHVNSKGLGDGKMSLTAPITVDQPAKTLALDNYDVASTLLTGVRRQLPKPQ